MILFPFYRTQMKLQTKQNQIMHYLFKSTPTATFKSRTQTVTKSNQPSAIPGPGDYNVNKLLPKTATIAQTKSKRELWKFTETSPGPGAYQPPTYITDGPKRSMSAKIIRKPPKIPGPGSYDTNNINTLIKTPAFSIGNKSKSPQKIIQQHNQYKPSPVLYQANSDFCKSTGVVFGSSNRKDLTETQKTPGPGYYQSERTQLTSTMNPRCAVGSQKRQLKIAVVEKTPGPGQYEKRNLFEQNKTSNKGFTCKQKLRNLIAEQIAKIPGPGQYQSENLQLKSTAPRCATVSQKRLTFIDEAQSAKKQLPAFTESQQKLFNSSKYRASSTYTLGKSQRKSLDENQNTPGPVAYSNDKIQIMKKKPSFSCPKTKQKNEFLKIMDPENPGPGQYDPKIEILIESTPSIIVMREKRPSFDKQRQKPGPGQYNLIKQKQPKFSWTKEKRIAFTDLKSESKNGTFYQIKSSIVNPPSYMNVNSKIQFSPTKSGLGSTGF